MSSDSYKPWFGGLRPRQTRDWSIYMALSGQEDRNRVRRIISHIRYRRWIFSVELKGEALEYVAFRPKPDDPGRLQMLGPWSLPLDSGYSEVLNSVLAVVISVDGERAREDFLVLEFIL